MFSPPKFRQSRISIPFIETMEGTIYIQILLLPPSPTNWGEILCNYALSQRIFPAKLLTEEKGSLVQRPLKSHAGKGMEVHFSLILSSCWDPDVSGRWEA